MKKISQNSKGFSIIEVLFVLVVVFLIIAAGIYISLRKNAPDTTSGGETTVIDTNEKIKTYESKYGGFSFKYPATWSMSGWKGTDLVATPDIKGDETQIEVNNQNDVNNFNISFTIYDKPLDKTPFDTYPNGKITVLDNSFILWEQKEDGNYATGSEKTTCPIISTGPDSSYSTKLESGKYLVITGSYCWGQGQTTNLSYNEQVSGQDWAAAVEMIKSISQ